MNAKKNLLDFIVVKENGPQWLKTEAGRARVVIPRNSFIDRAVRVFKNTPRAFTADLDEFGSFVCEAIDGKKTVFEIGALLKGRFGSDIEPVYERLASFLCLLKNNKLIRFEDIPRQSERYK
jgi:hypothetical protein